MEQTSTLTRIQPMDGERLARVAKLQGRSKPAVLHDMIAYGAQLETIRHRDSAAAEELQQLISETYGRVCGEPTDAELGRRLRELAPALVISRGFSDAQQAEVVLRNLAGRAASAPNNGDN